jgi:hypothetical protein
MGFNDLVFPYYPARALGPVRSGSIKGTVLHHTAGTSLAAARSHFQNPSTGVSAHFGVGPGDIERWVPDNRAAPATGNTWHNANCISIEHVNLGVGWPWTLAAETLVLGSKLCAAIHRRHGCGRPQHGVNVWMHRECSSTECPGHYFAENLSLYLANAQHYYDTQAYDSSPPFSNFGGGLGSGGSGSGGSDGGVSSGPSQIAYKVRTRAHGWLPEVLDLDDYAGWQDSPVTDVMMKVVQGWIEYQVHLVGGGWLPMVNGYNSADHNNGYAGMGNGTSDIDAIRAYLHSPTGQMVVKYRVAPVGGGYYDWQRDNETTGGQDGYAGLFGQRIGKFQACITDY